MQNASSQDLTFESLKRPLAYRFFNTLGSSLNTIGLAKTVLDVDSLLETAKKATRLDDFGSQSFHVPLNQLVDSLKSEAQLNFVGKNLSKKMLVELLSERLRVQEYIKRNPETLSEKINRPLFVIGMPRSGTSFLFNLLCQDTNSSCIKYWELYNPPQSFIQDKQLDQAIAEKALLEKCTKELVKKKRLMPQLDQIHAIDALGPYECFHLLERDFVCHTFGLYANVPTYIERIESDWMKADPEASTSLYKRYYQQIQVIKNLHSQLLYSQGKPTQEVDKHWVFKSPVHLWAIDEISNTLPDASFVHIHRDPLSVIPSICSFIALGRAVLSDQVDLKKIGKTALHRWSTAIDRALNIRREHPSLKIIDVHYGRFIKDPVNAVRAIYHQLDYDFPSKLEENLSQYIYKSKKSGRGQKNKYSLQQFGLEESEVRDSFQNYYQFLSSI
ncbi:MAG: sulfotransferase [Leptolyngbyaceae cyanobacterium MAG.088]|nr:sulfotransferase [Leptolyngbyaceae cyanobacterium MAG.088]